MPNLQDRVARLERLLADRLAEDVKEIPLTTTTMQPIALNNQHPVLSGVRLSPGDVVHVRHQLRRSDNGFYRVTETFHLERMEQ